VIRVVRGSIALPEGTLTRAAWLLLCLVLATTACDPSAAPPPARWPRTAVDKAVSAALAGDLRQFEPPKRTTVARVANLAQNALAGEDVTPPARLELTHLASEAGDISILTERHRRLGVGVYALRTGAGSPARLVVEVPHPRADLHTEVLGPVLFDALHADALLVATTHRSVADVAHRSDTVFAGVDAAIVGAGTVVVQVHGFDESRHDGSAQVVLSSTETAPSPLLRRLADKLADADFNTCVYDGIHCRSLAGTRNVEAAHARSVGAEFVHLELATGIRSDAQQRERLAETLASALR
jgi:hypothetical protein